MINAMYFVPLASPQKHQYSHYIFLCQHISTLYPWRHWPTMHFLRRQLSAHYPNRKIVWTLESRAVSHNRAFEFILWIIFANVHGKKYITWLLLSFLIAVLLYIWTQFSSASAKRTLDHSTFFRKVIIMRMIFIIFIEPCSLHNNGSTSNHIIFCITQSEGNDFQLNFDINIIFIWSSRKKVLSK